MKIAYAILHVESNENRKFLVLKNKEYLNNYATDLNQKTYGIYNKEQLEQYYSEDTGLNINRSIGFRYAEVGCWASHHMAWKTFYESDYDAVVIFEDDIEIQEGFFEDLNETIKELPEDWDIYFPFLSTGSYSYYKTEHYIGNKKICKSYQGNWLGAYLINKSGAKKLLDRAKETISRPVDIHIFYSPGLVNSYSIMPYQRMFVNGVNLGTTIHNVDRIVD